MIYLYLVLGFLAWTAIATTAAIICAAAEREHPNGH